MAQTENEVLIGGATQSGLRDHNERLLLSLVRQHGPIAGSDLARRTTLSAQTVSVILRHLENDNLLRRGAPLRGKVGKPSIPMELWSDGALAIGLKIGRRTAELALMDLTGRTRGQRHLTYPYPLPGPIFDFARAGIAAMLAGLAEPVRRRVCGMGLAVPFEMWNWSETIGAPAEALKAWRDVDYKAEIARFSDLPVTLMNDATAACRAEVHFGPPPLARDYAYFFVGALIGGGVVLNGQVFDGAFGNAGAFGPILTFGADDRPMQLLDAASLHLLERRISQAGGDPAILWHSPQDWSSIENELAPWLEISGRAIAQAAVSACAVIDFGAVVIDGAFPATVRARLTAATRSALDRMDTRSLIRPEVREGSIGGGARVKGAAYAPLSAQYFLDGQAMRA